MTWLPDGFAHPVHVEIPGGCHLRPISGADAPLDYPAVMGSRERLWSIYGKAWGWPSETMTYEANQADLERHAHEIEAHQSFNYTVENDDRTALLGCVYIDPPEKAGADAEISWWVVDSEAGGGLERSLDTFVPRWIAEVWPFERPRFVGRDLSWDEWLALPDLV
ncbi:GNAT family N-acetyltransferase [Streptomyces cavernae]|uniref:GNAT family N-acetyltransferase n=1 Tax=Streptomyces cavernae TaxID=2259034 RepID=UPI000FEBACB6|nr:GNAT family N-acetyltransferase [Streptomyces cavernae]